MFYDLLVGQRVFNQACIQLNYKNVPKYDLVLIFLSKSPGLVLVMKVDMSKLVEKLIQLQGRQLYEILVLEN